MVPDIQFHLKTFLLELLEYHHSWCMENQENSVNLPNLKTVDENSGNLCGTQGICLNWIFHMLFNLKALILQ